MDIDAVPTPQDIPALRQIAAATRSGPFEGHLFAVGGFLRDQMLGRWNGDEVDIVVEGDALALAHLLHQLRVASGPPVTYPRFGTAMLRVNNMAVELVTARRESYDERSRKPEVEPASVEEDALRRDFTINTLLQNIHTGEWSDPTGEAFSDLQAGILRTPLDPDQTFFDDPLRMMRAARFLAQLGFEIHPDAAESIRRCSGRLAVISKERIRDEWNKLLLSSRPAAGLSALAGLGLLARFLPELSAISESTSSSHPSWKHTINLLGAVPATASLPFRMAVVLHTGISSRDVHRLMTGLRYSKPDIARVALLLELRERVVSANPAGWSEGEIRRFVRLARESFEEWRQFASLDQAHGDAALQDMDLPNFLSQVEQLEAILPSRSLDSPLSGEEIMECLNLEPGPAVKKAKEWLLNEVLEGRLERDNQPEARKLLCTAFSDSR